MPSSFVLSHRPTQVALLVAGAFFMENFDGTVIATALPQMARTFDTTPASLAIGMTAYLLTLAVFIPASGWIADRFGARSVFAGAIALFTVASVCCGASDGIVTFTLARILQGGAGALMTPVGRLVVLRGTAKADLMQAIATLTWPALVAPVLGPPVGGFITQAFSWRWIFLINVPLGLMGLVLALRLIENDVAVDRRPFDRTGFLLIGLSLASLLYALDRFGQADAGLGAAALAFVASVVLGGLALRHARRHPHPLVSLDAFVVPSFAITMSGGFLARLVISTMPFLLPLLFQVGLGMNAFVSGLLVLWYGAANLAIKPLTGPLLRRFGFRTVLMVNMAIIAGSIAACALIASTTSVVVIVALLLVAGASRSMQLTALNTLAFAEVDPVMTGQANTLLHTAYQLAVGTGIAFGAITLRLASAAVGAPEAAASRPFQLTFVLVGLAALFPIASFRRLRADAGAAVSGHAAR